MNCTECGAKMKAEVRVDDFNDWEYILYTCPKCGHTIRKLLV
jgi:RNase P subunit RPR2